MKVQAGSLHLNVHIIGFRPQTQKLGSPHKTPSSTDSGSERFKSTEASFIQLKGVVVKFLLSVFSGLSLTVFSFIYQDNLLKKTMVYWSPKRRENCACICWFRNWLHQNNAPCLISLFNKNTDVNANSITPVFHQHSAWRKIKVEFIAKRPELWSRHGSVVCWVFSLGTIT